MIRNPKEFDWSEGRGKMEVSGQCCWTRATQWRERRSESDVIGVEQALLRSIRYDGRSLLLRIGHREIMTKVPLEFYSFLR